METIHLDNNKAFAFYKLPNSTNISGVVDVTKSTSKTIEVDTIKSHKGFAFSPFQSKDKLQLIEGIDIDCVSLDNLIFNSDLEEFMIENSIDFSKYSNSLKNYTKAFDSEFSKAILSRPIHVELIQNTNPILLFEELCKAHPTAFVYCLHTSNYGLWIGATPEVFLTEENDVIKTVALAGTQPYGANLSWGDKELEEQAIVSRYIADELSKLNLNYIQSNVESVKAGGLAHLKTSFTIDQSNKLPQLISALHPTPAVCGMPKDKALELILENENYDRALYTGFLGPIGDGIHLFVNLRCMQLFAHSVIVYVGGGITKDSILEKEWEETELKAQTMLAVLEKNRTLHS